MDLESEGMETVRQCQSEEWLIQKMISGVNFIQMVFFIVNNINCVIIIKNYISIINKLIHYKK